MAVIVSVLLLLLLIVPTFHIPFAGLYVPCDAVCDTYVYPFGNRSVNVTLFAACGHALLSTIVNVTFDPIVGVELFTVLVTDKSACCGGCCHTVNIAEHVHVNQLTGLTTVIVNVYVQAVAGVA